ncbi:methyltransferase domain-containing protein [bacterium]|nr:methyltransferase domain-containing protein [bacterium]
MINLTKRSQQTELLDSGKYTADELHRNLYELELINRYLGGAGATCRVLKKLFKSENKTWKIIDIGCGGGDMLRAIYRLADKMQVQVELTGLDLLPEAIKYAEQKSAGLPINYICADFNSLEHREYDIAMSSLFCHHLYGTDLRKLLRVKSQIASYWMINDLHRHVLAYYSIKWLTAFFSKSRLVKNDACLSVARSFRRHDWHTLMQELSFTNYKISWHWAFRWVVFAKSEGIIN